MRPGPKIECGASESMARTFRFANTFFGACLYRIICIGAGMAASAATAAIISVVVAVAAAAFIADLSVFMVLFLSFCQNYRFAFIHFVSNKYI